MPMDFDQLEATFLVEAQGAEGDKTKRVRARFSHKTGIFGRIKLFAVDNHQLRAPMADHPLAYPGPVSVGENSDGEHNTPNYERSLRLSDNNRPKNINKAVTPSAPLPKLTTISCGLREAGLGGSGAGMVGEGAGVNVAVAVTSTKEVGVGVRVTVTVGVSGLELAIDQVVTK